MSMAGPLSFGEIDGPIVLLVECGDALEVGYRDIRMSDPASSERIKLDRDEATILRDALTMAIEQMRDPT